MAILAPEFVQDLSYTAKRWRRGAARFAGIINPVGVWGENDFKVTAGTGMGVNVAAGVMVSLGYYLENDAAITNAATLSNAHGTLPRFDQIVLQIGDVTDLATPN